MVDYVGRIRQGNCRGILFVLEAELRTRLDRRPSLNQLILQGFDSLDDRSIQDTRGTIFLQLTSAYIRWSYVGI